VHGSRDDNVQEILDAIGLVGTKWGMGGSDDRVELGFCFFVP